MLPTINMEGTMVADPTLRFTQSGDAVVSFRLACNDRRMNKQTNQWEDGSTTFLSCTAWRAVAENVTESLRKGDLVVVTGKLEQRDWEQDGQKRTTFEVRVDSVGPSLRFRKTVHAEVAQRGQPQEDPWASPPVQQQAPPQQAPPQQQQQSVQQQRQPVPAQQGNPWSQPPPYDEPPF